MESKKKNISLRLSQGDIDKVRLISDRIGVKESDVLRFAIKQMLTKLAPFQEESYRGVDLMPALLEVGEELVRFFELNADELDQIVNEGEQDERRVIDSDDLRLLALSSINEKYARLKLNSDSSIYVEDEEGFKEYFLNKYFSGSESANSEKKQREWKPYSTKNGIRLTIPKTA